MSRQRFAFPFLRLKDYTVIHSLRGLLHERFKLKMKINMEQLWEKRGGKLILKQLTSFHSIGLKKKKQAYSLETTSVILLQFSQ